MFIFRSASTLITGSASSVLLTNGAQACNVYWQIGSSATLGSNSTFIGHVIAQASIGKGAGTSVHGQLIALTGAVTLINTSIVNNLCNVPSPIVTATPEATIPTTVVVPAVVPAKLHIIKVVVNREAGKATAATFSIRVTHNGIDVAGSPGQGVG